MGPHLPLLGSGTTPRALPIDASPTSAISGLFALWEETNGDPEICVAILDTPLDLGDRFLASAQIEQACSGDSQHCLRHGTEVASIIFSPENSEIRGIAPRCQGISIPIFDCDPGPVVPADQRRLARAIHDAVEAGAHIVNVSAGQLVADGPVAPSLLEAVQHCARAGVLIVAAAGNEGCECLHVPACLPGVLSVGALSRNGHPLEDSNWGPIYRQRGILAPGEDILVATREGRPAPRTGTSYAAAVVSGAAALLLSRERKRGRAVRPGIIGQALLAAAVPCDRQTTADCRRYLAGTLNIPGTISLLDRWSKSMIDEVNFDSTLDATAGTSNRSEACCVAAPVQPTVGGLDFERHITPSHRTIEGARPNSESKGVQPSACCAACGSERILVYALGQLGYDFGSEAGLDAYRHRMKAMPHPGQSANGSGAPILWREANPLDDAHLVAFLEAMSDREPWHAATLHWTLNVGSLPIYVIRPDGPFAREAYERLRQFFAEQFQQKAERIAVPGVITGQATLLNGQQVPVINPDLRGLSNWPTEGLIDAVLSYPGDASTPANAEELRPLTREFLDRIYFELRNAGRTPQERALNYAGTNLVSLKQILGMLHSRRTLDTIRVERSTVCRPSSDCWDITVSFFDPEQPMQTIRTIYRYTVDVSEVIPVTVGDIRSWTARV
jgi:cyanobactin maturation PatA/PatG family protease